MFAAARTATTSTLRTTLRRVVQPPATMTKRGMAGSHGAKPEWTGIDKTVRSYFPEDYQRTLFLHIFGTPVV